MEFHHCFIQIEQQSNRDIVIAFLHILHVSMNVVNEFFAVFLGEVPCDSFELIFLDSTGDILKSIKVFIQDIFLFLVDWSFF
jgi:Co/Zn/Cd efflux system component